MPRVLLISTTTGYQVRSFGEAAERLGVDLVYATDRCHVLDDPWRDEAIAVRFHDEDQSVAAILEASRTLPLDGVLAVGDRPTVIAAGVLKGLGLPGHPPEAATIARHKRRTREVLQATNLSVPWHSPVPLSTDPHALAGGLTYPCVLKPLALSGSRGVIRANDPGEFVAAFFRLRALLQAPDIRDDPTDVHETVLVEGFIPGREFAVEGLLEHGQFRALAIFEKPDALDGPFFEETIYLTPPRAGAATVAELVESVGRASEAIGLRHGPVHAECRVNERGVYVLEVAARPIGGLCARTLRFQRVGELENSKSISFEELLLRHALGEPSNPWIREPGASGVMMIPIPRRGVFRRVSGLEEARAVRDIEDVRITAKADQLLVPLPEGASYLGFIFSRAPGADAVDRALRAAHQQLEFFIDPEVRVLQSLHG